MSPVKISLTICVMIVVIHQVMAFQCYSCHGLYNSGCAKGDTSSMQPIDCPTGTCYTSNVSNPNVGVSRDCAIAPCVVLYLFGIVEHPCVECTTNLCNTGVANFGP